MNSLNNTLIVYLLIIETNQFSLKLHFIRVAQAKTMQSESLAIPNVFDLEFFLEATKTNV